MNPEDLNWGQVTPEMYDRSSKTAGHVINANLVGEGNADRVIKFLCARIVHFDRHLPPGSVQHVRFDLRGQTISDRTINDIRAKIVSKSAEQQIEVAVDFLTSN